jgi:transcriptional regulator with XRE-family HTH domain
VTTSPDPPAADLVTVWSDVSERLRRARAASRLTLRALASRIGVSPSLISQIETGKVRPSLNTLYALAIELGLSVDELLFGAQLTGPREPPGEGMTAACVQRAGARASVELADGVLWERLTGASEAGVDFLHLTYAPGSASVPEGAVHRHRGREWGYVLRGVLRVEVDDEVVMLAPGDSIAFASTAVHRLSNPGADEVRAVWFVLGRPTADAPDGQA